MNEYEFDYRYGTTRDVLIEAIASVVGTNDDVVLTSKGERVAVIIDYDRWRAYESEVLRLGEGTKP